ncbi:MAG: DUF4373 domain-containing protein [Muribaculaceae bacterium]|nr:DUF4373 domain-containing protein [Muribaculaceae bacterium]
MKKFRHSTNERNKSNVLKLRMKYGAAGYGVYMMLLERLADEPRLCAELDYDVLAFDFHESAELIRHVVEDFDLFIIDLESETFSNEELNSQFFTKAKKEQQTQILDNYIQRVVNNPTGIDFYARKHETSPERIRALVQTSFRDKILSVYNFIPEQRVLNSILNACFNEVLS